jgi:hypothetical protein
VGGINWGDVPTWAAVLVGAVGGTVALIQLRQQGNVLKGEVERNKRRDELLDGQLRDLQRRTLVAERQQADAITLELVKTESDPPVWVASVTNAAERPVRNVSCRLSSADGNGDLVAANFGRLVDWAPGREVLRRLVIEAEPGSSLPLLRAGLTYSFGFEKGPDDYPDATVTARFTDDAGMHWQIDHDLHLTRLDNRDDW